MLQHMIQAWVQEAVDELLEEHGHSNNGERPIRAAVERPSLIRHGDYATSAAMQLTRLLRKPPSVIAEAIRSKLLSQEKVSSLIAHIEVAHPGYVNLVVNWGQWAQASFPLPKPPKGKAVIEHTSINPNKSAHIGHLRNSCIGDTLSRLLARCGWRTEVHNYIDDLGNQLADTLVGLLHLPTECVQQRFGDFCWEVYSGINREYDRNPQLLKERERTLHALEAGNNNLAWLGLAAAERIVREHLEEMAQFGIAYDLLVWESCIVREGFWEQARLLLEKTPCYSRISGGKLDGCWVIRPQGYDSSPAEAELIEGPAKESGERDDTSSAGVQYSLDKVLVRSNGVLTYTAKDIAYHLWKFGLLPQDFRYSPFNGTLMTTSLTGEAGNYGQAETVINVIDQRQAYPQAIVKQALEALGYQEQAGRLRHVSYGIVSLSPAAATKLGVDTSEAKASYAMSGRQGIGIKNKELLDEMERTIGQKRVPGGGALSDREIAAAAIRYYLLRFNVDTEVVFDMEQATETTGNTGVYLLYAHARACSILAKSGYTTEECQPPASFPLLQEEERALLCQLAAWQDTLLAACRELAPHFICSYAYELAAQFSRFYAVCPVLRAEGVQRELRLWLLVRFRETLADALQVLGLPAPSTM